jgi:hypothetical protein
VELYNDTHCHLTCLNRRSTTAPLHRSQGVHGPWRSRFGHLEFRGRLGNGVGRRGHVVDDATLGIESVRPWAVDSNLMR